MNNCLRFSLLAIAAAVMTTLAGCATIPDNSTIQPATDTQLADAVLQRLTQDAMTSRSAFGVVAENGVVTLYGSLPDDILRARAIAIARSTPGVKDVINKITRW
jgi:hyperosmotically inducible periplasmic protein